MTRKKLWRKKIDITNVEELLQEKQNQIRLGGILSEKTDTELFIIDSKGNPKVKFQLKKLRIDEILTPTSNVPVQPAKKSRSKV